MGQAHIRSNERLEGFLVAVFAFKSEENEKRSALRGILKEYGFKKLAQNSYIHGRIETRGLRSAIRDQGLEKHLFLFTCPVIEDKDLIKHIFELFDIEGRRKALSMYLARLKAFLPGGLSRAELARRLLYVGAVHWEHIEAGEPPFPARYLLADYALARIQQFYGQKLAEGHEVLLSYYKEVNR